MVPEGPARVLHGRRGEREALEQLLKGVRDGQSRVLVVCGEAGVGKTALVECAISSASGFRVMRTVGVDSEMELAFAALRQLCAPMLYRLDRLPAPQQDALGVAFGLRAGEAPDRFLVGWNVAPMSAYRMTERVVPVENAFSARVRAARRIPDLFRRRCSSRCPGERRRGDDDPAR